jgi:hypothetical protein
MSDKSWDDNLAIEQTAKLHRNKLSEIELDELREHVDLVSFNIEKVYRQAKDRTRKEYNQAKHSLGRKLHHSYKNEKTKI